MAVGGRVDIDDAAILQLMTGPAGPVGRYMAHGGETVTQGAKRRAPVGKQSKTPEGHPSGYLRSQIAWTMARDGEGIYVDVETSAVTSQANPFPGEPYSLYQEDPSSQKTPHARHWGSQPYLVPALADWPTS